MMTAFFAVYLFRANLQIHLPTHGQPVRPEVLAARRRDAGVALDHPLDSGTVPPPDAAVSRAIASHRPSSFTAATPPFTAGGFRPKKQTVSTLSVLPSS
jgi:hypothetical protein